MRQCWVMAMIKEPFRCEDAGFFGPDSISWRISGPTIFPGVVATGAYFFLNPWLANIGVSNSTGATDPWKRIVLTTEYMFAIYFGPRSGGGGSADRDTRISQPCGQGAVGYAEIGGDPGYGRAAGVAVQLDCVAAEFFGVIFLCHRVRSSRFPWSETRIKRVQPAGSRPCRRIRILPTSRQALDRESNEP